MRALFFAAIIATAAATAPAAADPCYDAPAVCHFKLGASLIQSDPKQAADELFASYKLDPQPKTLALYAYALHLDHRYAASFDAWTDARAALRDELDAKRSALLDQKAAGSARDATVSQAAVDELQNQVANAESELGSLAPLTARVHLRLADGVAASQVVVARKGEGDIRDLSRPVTVNADSDTLVVTYADGKVLEIAIAVAGGDEKTVVIPAEEAPPTPAQATPQPALAAPAPPPMASAQIADRAPEPHASHVLRWAGVGSFAIAAAAIGIAATFSVESNNDFKDAKSAGCTENASGTFVCPTSAAKSLGDRSNSRANIALGAGVAAGAFAVAGVVLIVVDHIRGNERSPSTEVTIAPARGGAIAALGWRF